MRPWRSPPPTEADEIWLSCYRSVLLIRHNEWITCNDGVALGETRGQTPNSWPIRLYANSPFGLRACQACSPGARAESWGTAADAPSEADTRLSPQPRLGVLAVAHPVHQRLLLAAIDLDHGPVDHMHQRPGQHGDKVGALLDLGDAAHGARRGRQRVRLLVGELHVAKHGRDQAGPTLGAHRTGIDGAETDV